MAIDHLQRIINMYPKRSLLELQTELQLTPPVVGDEVQHTIEQVKQNPTVLERLLKDYKYIFKPSSSHIYTYSLNPLVNYNELDLGDWSIEETHQVGNKLYWLVEKDSASKRISTGWEYLNVTVKQVGIVVLHTDLNVLEIRSNAIVQKQLEKKLTGLFLSLESLSIDRAYYTAVLEELNAKEFSIVWGTEGQSVTKAQIEGSNVSVKNAAAIHIRDENDEIIIVDLGTEGTPESVWSTINGSDTKVLLSAKGNLRVSKLIREEELNNLVIKIISALNGLIVTQNQDIDFSDVNSIRETFLNFCEGTKRDILNRFSKRYLAFRCMLSNTDAESMLEFLMNEGYIKEDYELVCQNNHHITTVGEMTEENIQLVCPICSDTETNPECNTYKKIYRLTDAAFTLLKENDVYTIEGTIESFGMNDPIFNDDPINEIELFRKEDRFIERMKQELEEAKDLGNDAEVARILNELNSFKSPKAKEIVYSSR